MHLICHSKQLNFENFEFYSEHKDRLERYAGLPSGSYFLDRQLKLLRFQFIAISKELT